MDLIEWNGDKSELRNVLENAISRKVYFRENSIMIEQDIPVRSSQKTS